MKIDALSRLPREARDTLFMLLVIAWVMLPMSSQLPLWCSALTAGVLLWRGSLAWRGQPLPSRTWRIGLLMVALAATLLSFRTLLGRDAGVTLVVVLLALKTLELRARRDAFVIFFLGFFTMLTNFFFSQSLLTAAAMLIALLGLLTALVNAHMVVGRPPLMDALKTASGMALLGAPIMAVLFVLFPRLAPLWGIPSDAMSGRSGLSASMQVGNIASLALDSSIAMRIKFEGRAPAQQDLYFRGPVLSRFDGREWQPMPARLAQRLPASGLAVSGPPVSYEVTLEPNNRPWIFVLEAAAQAPRVPGFETVMTPDLQWLASRPITDIVRYQATSYTQFDYGPRRADNSLQPYRTLPVGFNPRTLALARELQIAAPAMPVERLGDYWINTVLERLRNGGYSYTLEPGLYGRDSADEFWFDRKAGFCEHIASSFVILMRALGLPARIVTGYQGGERNALDGFWTVRQSDAHAWAEVWLSGRGWVRVDPTTAVAPARTGRLLRLQGPGGALPQALLGQIDPALAVSLRAAWDALNNRWNQWVLNYSQTTQFDLLRALGVNAPSWEDLIYLMCGIVVVSALLAATLASMQRARRDPWLRLLAQAHSRLQKQGLATDPNSTPRELAEQVRRHARSLGPQAPAFADWLLHLEAWRYGTNPPDLRRTRQGLATLQREFRQLRPQHRRP